MIAPFLGTVTNAYALLSDDLHASKFAGPIQTPTLPANDNSTNVATTSYADNNIIKRYSCGTGTTCVQTALTKPLLDAYGVVQLSGGTATVTGVPTFSSTTTSQCSCEDNDVPLQSCEAHLATVSSVVVNGNTNDHVDWHCFGN